MYKILRNQLMSIVLGVPNLIHAMTLRKTTDNATKCVKKYQLLECFLHTIQYLLHSFNINTV